MSGKFKEIIGGDTPVLVDFHATWCQPCKMQSPILQELSAEMGEKIRVLKIDVDKNPAVAQAYRVQGVPTLVIFKKGKIVWRNSGVHSKEQLKGILNQFLN
ncbi:MAG: thioredoxin [Bacteroidales bacterium]|jgi:thioredoxin 1|nr:thioredoxin [Bacteroidales bacterium]